MPAEPVLEKPVPERSRGPAWPHGLPHPALEHPSRQRILDAVRREPGLSFRAILRATGIPAGTAGHHLNVLLRAGLAWEHRLGRLGSRLLHFAGRRPASRARVLAAVARVLDENPRRVLELVRELAPCHQAPILEAAEALVGLSRSTTQHILRRLEDYGLLTAFAQGRRVMYEIPWRPQSASRWTP